MTKNRNARKNSKRKTSPCNPKGDEQLLRFALSSGQSIEIRSSEKLQATRLCGESPDHPDFTLCDLIFDATSSRICLPRELWDNGRLSAMRKKAGKSIANPIKDS